MPAMLTPAPCTFIRRLPPAPLREFVEAMWYRDGRPIDAPERLLPNARGMLVVNLADPYEATMGATLQELGPVPDSWICGIHTRPILCRPCGATRLYGVVFRPQAIAPLFRIAGPDSAGQAHSLGDVIGRAAGELRERLGEAQSSELGFQILADFLTRRVAQATSHWIARTAPMVLESGRLDRIDTLCRELDV